MGLDAPPEYIRERPFQISRRRKDFPHPSHLMSPHSATGHLLPHQEPTRDPSINTTFTSRLAPSLIFAQEFMLYDVGSSVTSIISPPTVSIANIDWRSKPTKRRKNLSRSYVQSELLVDSVGHQEFTDKRFRFTSCNIHNNVFSQNLRMPAPAIPSRLFKKALRLICLIMILGMLAVALWPFNPFPRNQVSWLRNQDGLRFGDPGIVFSTADFRWPPSAPSAAAAPQDVGCTLEIWLEPAPSPGREAGIILAFYQPRAPLRIRLFAWQNSVMVLYRDDDQSRHQEIDLDGVFRPQTPVLITIASGPGGSSAFLDGVLAGTSPALQLSVFDLSGQLVLGSSPVQEYGWTGQVRGLALYGRKLSSGEIARHPGAWTQGMDPAAAAREGALALYTFQERSGDLAHDRLDRSPNLYIPRSFQLPHKPLLRVWRSDFSWRSNWQDIIINVVGFMPLGFFLCAYLSADPPCRRAVLLAIFLGALFSLLIELLQFYVPARASNVSDIVTNSFGTFLGALLYRSRIVQSLLTQIALPSAEA